MMMFKLNQNGLDVRKDEYGRLAATIKAHGEREGVKQTIVCRSKVLA